jgi:hypothetical protein
MFGAQKPLETGEGVSTGVSEDALYADFGKALGGRTRFNNLGRLVNLGFVVRRNKWLDEGPMLDLMIDYSQLAPRIIEGALSEYWASAATRPPTHWPTRPPAPLPGRYSPR